MLREIRVSPLWVDGKLMLDNCYTVVSCDDLASVRWAWLVWAGCCGGSDYRVSFSSPSADQQDVFQGPWIQSSGRVMVLNANSIDDLISACDQCCGTASDKVPVHYVAPYVLPPVIEVTPQKYTFLRSDWGDRNAYMKALLDYFGQYIPDTFTKGPNQFGKSSYSFMAYSAPVFVTGDTPSGGFINTFMSNEPPSLKLNQVYEVNISVNSNPVGPTVQGTSLQAILHVLQTDITYSSLGIWGLKGDRITLMTPNSNVSIQVDNIKVAGNVIFSNSAPANGADMLYRLTATVSGVALIPPIYGDTLIEIVSALNGFTGYPQAGNWFVDGDRIALITGGGDTATLVIAGGISRNNRIFDSNVAPALQAGNTYDLTMNKDGSVLSPVLQGDPLSTLVSKAASTPPYSTLGNWSVQGGTKVRLLVASSNTVMNALLTIGQGPRPPLVVDSNAAPSLSAGQHLSMQITLDAVNYPPAVTGPTVDSLVASCGLLPVLPALGTWSVEGGNKVRLTAPNKISGALTIFAAANFVSNIAPTLQGGNTYNFTVYVNNVALSPVVLGDSLAIIRAQLPQLPAYAPLNINNSGNTTMQIASSTESNIYMVIGQQTKPAFILDSNHAPVLSAGQHYEMVVTLNMSELSPPITGGSVADLANAATADSLYQVYGTWSVQGTDQVRLSSGVVDNGQIVISAVADPAAFAARPANQRKRPANTTQRTPGKTGKTKASKVGKTKGKTKTKKKGN